ncbi:glycosyltransferase family 2 protein [Microbacterium sp. NPDC091313]
MTSAPQRPAKVDIIVPVHGGWEFVRRCLLSLMSQSMDVRVIVVDDASPDDTADRVAAEFPTADLIRNGSNRGFAASCNAGIRRGDGDVVILMNSDVEAEPDLARSVVDAFAHDAASVASVSPILLTADGLVDSFGIVADRTGAGFVRYHGADLKDADADEPPLLGPYGAVAAYRRSALDEVGLLDERIFMYGEELDLALRLRASGWDARALDRVVGKHLGGASAGRGSARQRYLAGFGRGYTLRVYGVLRTASAAQALTTEIIVSLLSLLLHRDVAGLRGRTSGWRAGAGVQRRSIPLEAVDRRIGLILGLRMRSARYWQTLRPRGEGARPDVSR